MKTKISWPLLLALLAVFFTVPARAEEDVPLQNPALKRFYAELKSLFRQHYPQATSHLLKDSIHFEHDTRIYIVHEATMTGEWQEPGETRGPKRGGILCDITLEQGQYEGQAVAPQTFDKRYFKTLFAAPNSSDRKAHLKVHLSYPRNVSEDFLKQFNALIKDFEKYLD